MNAVLDYFEDHNMLEVKTKDDKGDIITIDTGIWSVYGDDGIRGSRTGSASIGVVVSGDHIIKT